MNWNERPKIIHECKRCKQIETTVEIGKNDYPEGKRPFLCQECYLDWSEYFVKTYSGNWKRLFEGWLHSKIETEKVSFT